MKELNSNETQKKVYVDVHCRTYYSLQIVMDLAKNKTTTKKKAMTTVKLFSAGCDIVLCVPVILFVGGYWLYLCF